MPGLSLDLGLGLGSVFGSAGPSLAQLAVLLFDDGMGGIRKGGLFDTDDPTSMFVERDGTGGNPSLGGVFGVWLDKKHMGGLSAAAYMAANSITDPLLCPGVHAVAAADSNRPTRVAAGVSLNGTSQHLAFTSNPLAGASVGTALVRSKLTSSPPSSSGAAGGNLGGFGVSGGSNDHTPFTDHIIYSLFGSNSRGTFGSLFALGTDEHTMEFHRGASVLKVFVDEVQSGSDHTSSVLWAANPHIGRSPAGGNLYSGIIGNIFIIETELSGDDLTTARNFVKKKL